MGEGRRGGAGAERRRLLEAAGTQRMKAKKTVRSLFSDLQIYAIKKNRWIDVRRQLPSRFALLESDEAGLDDTPRVMALPQARGHTLTILAPSPVKRDT